jgi:glycosyltransferase involved in cell wall biosynthesis
MTGKRKVAIVYDRVNKWGGAEKVLLALHEIFPEATLYTAVYDSKKAPWAKVFPKVIPSFLQKIPFLNKHHELLGAFTPIAFETLKLTGLDLVISVTSEAAKGIITRPQTKHICYCLTPTRYLYSGYEDYLNNPPSKLSWIPFYKLVSKPFLYYARYWDQVAAQRPDEYVAISTEVRRRIRKYYNRDSEVIYPPVDIEKFQNSNIPKLQAKEKSKVSKEEYYLVVGRLVPYKRVDLAIRAFNKLGDKLVVVGTGSEEKYLRSIAKNNIEFKGYVSDEEVVDYFLKATAFLYPQEEDFGITAVEAQAAGCPVIAYKAGGVLDTVIDGKTGVFFDEQKEESLLNAIKRLKQLRLRKSNMVANAKRYSKENFQKEFDEMVKKVAK